jgi:hypothetical protein
MSDEADANDASKKTAEEDENLENVEELEEPALSALLKRSLVAVPSETEPPTKEEAEQGRLLLVGVQRKLRQRSKGKFYNDGWSTSASRVNYALVAGVMLVVIVAVYLAMGPMGISLH